MITNKEPRLKIVTDGVLAENTFVYLDGQKVQFLQDFSFEAASQKLICPVSMSFIPFRLEDIITEENDIEAQKAIPNFKHKLTITSDGKSTGTFIYMDDKLVSMLQLIKIHATTQKPEIDLELIQVDLESLKDETGTIIMKDDEIPIKNLAEDFK